jgi:hypothetical protein
MSTSSAAIAIGAPRVLAETAAVAEPASRWGAPIWATDNCVDGPRSRPEPITNEVHLYIAMLAFRPA